MIQKNLFKFLLFFAIVVGYPNNANSAEVSITSNVSNTPKSIGSTNTPMPTDTRIKTFIYSPNEIFQVKFMIGYQSIIELQEGEEVELISFGDPTPWTVRVLGRRVFLKVVDPGVKTNMTIITDKRTYLLEISSNESEDDVDARTTYVLRFFYPNINVDVPPATKKLARIALNGTATTLANAKNNANSYANARSGVEALQSNSGGSMLANKGNINTNYTFSGSGKDIVPSVVFDDGERTYFKFTNNNIGIPQINAVMKNGEEVPLNVRANGEYVFVNSVEGQFSLRTTSQLVCIFNEDMSK